MIRQLNAIFPHIWEGMKHNLLLRLLVLTLVPIFCIVSWDFIAKSTTTPHPKVILISLDGAAKDRVEQFLATGVLNPKQGIGLIKSKGIYADQNITCNPSLTAACHTMIATGSTSVNNDIPDNTFHLVASPLKYSVSGFSAPIGGYSLIGPAAIPTKLLKSQPIWVNLLANGKKVVTATFPGGDGTDVKVPGLSNSPVIQDHSLRTVTYTVPFGSNVSGKHGQGFSLTAANFTSAPSTTIDQLKNAGKVSYSGIQQASLGDNNTIGGVSYDIQVAALDTSNDHQTNYDTLVFFDSTIGIQPGPFSLPSTGPAYVVAKNKKSSPFYFEGSSNQAGTAFYVSHLAPDLSTVRIARYSIVYIPTSSIPSTNTQVLANVQDILTHVGTWGNQPDYGFPERTNAGINNFPITDLEAIYEDQVANFVDYQTRVGLRAINQNPDADLVMIYIEQPDGSEHQFLLTDPRQASDPTDATTIGDQQDRAKIARYASYVRTAYKVADNAVQKIIQAVGTNRQGVPNSNIFVVSDHGFSTFHTSVNLTNYLQSQGISTNQVKAYTSGPAANIYINLAGRESDGSVSQSDYANLQQKIVNALNALTDTNSNYIYSGLQPVFDQIYSRPAPTGIGTSSNIGQDFGDVLAILHDGYNFDGFQSSVTRSGDANTSSPIFSVSNFYGAHGYDPNMPKLSAIMYAAGPNINRRGSVGVIHNTDIAPTINGLLGVPSAATVNGRAFPLN